MAAGAHLYRQPKDWKKTPSGIHSHRASSQDWGSGLLSPRLVVNSMLKEDESKWPLTPRRPRRRLRDEALWTPRVDRHGRLCEAAS